MFGSLKIQNVSNFYFEKQPPENSEFKGPLFRNGWFYWYECWRVLRDGCGLSEKYTFATFYSESYINLNIESRPKFNSP